MKRACINGQRACWRWPVLFTIRCLGGHGSVGVSCAWFDYVCNLTMWIVKFINECLCCVCRAWGQWWGNVSVPQSENLNLYFWSDPPTNDNEPTCRITLCQVRDTENLGIWEVLNTGNNRFPILWFIVARPIILRQHQIAHVTDDHCQHRKRVAESPLMGPTEWREKLPWDK